MTEEDPSESPELKTSSSRDGLRPLREEDVCEACGGPMRLRNARPFPVALQAVFGLSFVGFLWAQGTGKLPSKVLWGWSAFQILLGALLVRARFASAKKVFICLRCGAPLR